MYARRMYLCFMIMLCATVLRCPAWALEITELEDFAAFEGHQQAVEYFGKDEVATETISSGNGSERQYITLVYPQGRNQVRIYWTSPDYTVFSHVEASINTSEALVSDKEGQVFPTRTGIALNSSMEELEKANGKPYSFAGLGGINEGLVSELGAKFSGYVICLGCPDFMQKLKSMPAESKMLLGDELLRSDNADIRKLAMTVFRVSYTPQPDAKEVVSAVTEQAVRDQQQAADGNPTSTDQPLSKPAAIDSGEQGQHENSADLPSSQDEEPAAPPASVPPAKETPAPAAQGSVVEIPPEISASQHPIDKKLTAALSGKTDAQTEGPLQAAAGEWDKELNRIYGELMKVLTKERQDALRGSERAWISCKDRQIELYAAVYKSLLSEESFPYFYRVMYLTRARALKLADYLEILHLTDGKPSYPKAYPASESEQGRAVRQKLTNTAAALAALENGVLQKEIKATMDSFNAFREKEGAFLAAFYSINKDRQGFLLQSRIPINEEQQALLNGLTEDLSRKFDIPSAHAEEQEPDSPAPDDDPIAKLLADPDFHKWPRDGFIEAENLNLRKEPSTSSPIVLKISHQNLIVLERKDTGAEFPWYRCSFAGREVWVYGRYVHLNPNTEGARFVLRTRLELGDTPQLAAQKQGETVEGLKEIKNGVEETTMEFQHYLLRFADNSLIYAETSSDGHGFGGLVVNKNGRDDVTQLLGKPDSSEKDGNGNEVLLFSDETVNTIEITLGDFNAAGNSGREPTIINIKYRRAMME